MICPHCLQADKIKNSSGPGRTLGAYAQTKEGATVEIPAALSIPQCACGALLIDPMTQEALHMLEKQKVGMAFPVL